MDAHELKRLERFLDDYDHGRMPGVTIPEIVVESTRKLIDEWVPPAGQGCEEADCRNVATWKDLFGSRWCDQHPEPPELGDTGHLTSTSWRWRYHSLRTRIQGAVGQNLSYQELKDGVEKALIGDMPRD